MIKRLFLILIILIIAVWLGVTLKANPGYILLTFGNWTLETPLWLGILLTIIAFIILYWLLRLLGWSLGLSQRIQGWRKRQKMSHAHVLTNQGLIAFAEGNWAVAEKKLQRSVHNSDTPLINYLASAHAAQEQGAYERRDGYLRMAHNANPDAKIAIGLTQAQLQLEHHQLEQALATLKHLREMVPNHKLILRLLKNVYLQLNDWQDLKDLLPTLRKQKIITPLEANELEVKIFRSLLESKIHNNTEHKSLYEFWHYEIPKRLHTNPDIVETFVNYLIIKNELTNAEQLIREALKKNWHNNLVKLYGEFVEGNGKKQLTQAESWLKTHKTDHILLLTLGRLSLINQLWGKAKSYLEASIVVKPTIDAYNELAQLCERLKEKETAADCYRRAISLALESQEKVS